MKEFTYHLTVLLFLVLFSNIVSAQGGDEPNNATILCPDSVAKTVVIDNSSTNRTASPTYPAPTNCAGVSAPNFSGYYVANPTMGGDVWFKLFLEQPMNNNSKLTINTVAGTLSTVSMAIYTTSNVNSPASFTQFACNDNQALTGNNMPKIALTSSNLQAGTWIYIRLWEEGQNSLGNFQIVASYTQRWSKLSASALNNKTVHVCQECPRLFTDSGGETGNYQPNENVQVTYCVENGKSVMMQYQTLPGAQINQQLSLQAQKRGNDYLYLYEGNLITAPTSANQIGVYTGADADYPQPGTVVSAGRCLSVRFNSNFDSTMNSSGAGLANAKGWSASIRATQAPFVNPVDTVTFADIKTFRSTNYPAPYNNNENSIWTYCPSSAEQAIWAVFTNDISLETNADYLNVYDGNSTSAALLNTYTGGYTQSGSTFTATNINRLKTIKATQTNTSGCLTFKFSSNASNAFGGWSADITTGPKRVKGTATGEDCATAITIPYTSGTRTYVGKNINSTANPSGGSFGAASGTTAGTDDPELDIVSCVGNNITRLENTIWYKFVAPNVICSGEIYVKLDNISSQNYSSNVGLQMAVYQTNGGCLGGAGWESSTTIPPIGTIKKYCQDKITSQTPRINLRPFIEPNKTYYILIDGFSGQHTNFDIVVKIGGDTDADGVCDTEDIDDDNDGIVDVVECGCGQGKIFGINCLARNPSDDTDGDGVPNYMDNINNDLNNNNIANENLAEIAGVMCTALQCGGINAQGICNVIADFDTDGVPNFLDLDSDGDGLVDIREAGGTDNDGNGKADLLIGSFMGTYDDDGDGLGNLYDFNNDDLDWNGLPDNYIGTSRTSLPIPNTDSVGNYNFLDLDSDDDGIIDNIEAQSTLGFIAVTGMDEDGDGIDDGYDNYSGFGGVGAGSYPMRKLPAYPTVVLPVSTLLSLIPDYINSDSDGDGISDLREGHDYNHNNSVIDELGNNLQNKSDVDDDGLLDIFDSNIYSRKTWEVNSVTGNCPGTVGLCIRQANFSLPEWQLPNPSDNDGEPDFRDNTTLLPFEYLNFVGEWKYTNAYLTWKMTETTTTDFFELQRSLDGINYTVISVLNPTTDKKYHYTDREALGLTTQKIYYRLRMVDFDGQSLFSDVVELATAKEETRYAVVSPNPAKNDIKFECFNLQASKLRIRIYTIQGVELKDEVFYAPSATYYHTTVDISHLSDGIYTYMILGGDDVPLTGKFIVSKWNAD